MQAKRVHVVAMPIWLCNVANVNRVHDDGMTDGQPGPGLYLDSRPRLRSTMDGFSLFHQSTYQASMTIQHLVVPLNDSKVQSRLLDEWTWLIGAEKHPHLVTAGGDVFVKDLRDGSIHFLEVSFRDFSPVADTAESFEVLLADPDFISAYLRSERVAMFRERGLLLKKNQVYSWSVPLSLGGQASVENVDITDVEVHFSIAGQLECQLAELPEGAPVTGIRIDRLPGKKPWWKFW